MNLFIDWFLKTVVETLYLIGMMIFVGFILGYLREHSMTNFQRSFGEKAVMITGFIGVPIHEISHAIFAVVFKHKITKIKLFQKKDAQGILGYVNHTYNPKSIYQQIGNFFIGVAPIIGGIAAIIGLMRVFIYNVYSDFINVSINNLQVTAITEGAIKNVFSSYFLLIKMIFSIKNFSNIYFIIFLFLAICISSHISLSKADIKGAFQGITAFFLVLFVFKFIFNILVFSKYVSGVNTFKYNIIMVDFLAVALIFSIITYCISWLLLVLKRWFN